MATRTFQMHPKLLVDVIKRQAGSIQKAILEGVMNAIEADASKVNVDVTTNKVVIDDDGKGFRSMKEIEQFFETFGQPHDKSENKVWAQFRMGRGQMFAFGMNLWRTGNFEMLVDINAMVENNSNISYELNEVKKNHKGCHIEIDLYEPLSDKEVNACRRELEKFVAYVSCPVMINGVQVNCDPSTVKWDNDSTDDAYIKLSPSEFKGLAIYNLGVLVCEIDQRVVGVGGTVVSKKRLDVNFARNDIIRSDPTWKRIKEAVEKASGLEKVKNKRVLSFAEREAMITRFLDGEDINIHKMRLIIDTNGKAYSLAMTRKFNRFTLGRRNDRRCDKVMQQGIALCVDVENAELFSPRNPKDMFKVIAEAGGYCQGLSFIPYKQAVKGINNNHTLIPPSNWRLEDRLWADFIEQIIYLRGNWRDRSKNRKVVIGESDVASAWTDGCSYVAFNRRILPKFRRDKSTVDLCSVAHVADLLAHEYCHVNEGSESDHNHDEEFYKRFHDEVRQWVVAALSQARSITPKRLDYLVKKFKSKKGKNADESEQEKSVGVAACCPTCGK